MMCDLYSAVDLTGIADTVLDAEESYKCQMDMEYTLSCSETEHTILVDRKCTFPQ
jgi:hypothetical protein